MINYLQIRTFFNEREIVNKIFFATINSAPTSEVLQNFLRVRPVDIAREYLHERFAEKYLLHKNEGLRTVRTLASTKGQARGIHNVFYGSSGTLAILFILFCAHRKVQ